MVSSLVNNQSSSGLSLAPFDFHGKGNYRTDSLTKSELARTGVRKKEKGFREKLK